MKPAGIALGIAACCFCHIAVAQTRITAGNRSAYVGNGRWAWTVYIQASPDVVRSIRCVEYTLHPTFPNPVRQVCQPGKGPDYFPLSTEGWGTFSIPIKVLFRDGKMQTLNWQLRFAQAQPEQAVTSLTVDNVARRETQTTWIWTVFLKGSDQDLNQVRCVEYTLHPTFPDPVREVCNRGAGPQAFALTATGWGTFEIGVRVLLKNGQVQQLKHQLRF